MAKKNESTEQDYNLRFYEQLRQVPQEALKSIGAGRLKGMSDVNPMWRIKAMTEAFGPCGIGWKYEITKQWHETYGQEIKAFCNINLYVKVDDVWSEPIPGTGGSSFVALESKGPFVSDECEKMALTDALSVAMKALGVAADVYFSKDPSKSQFDTKYAQQGYVQQSVQQSAPQINYQAEINACANVDALMALWNKYPQLQQDKGFRDMWAAKRGQLENQAK